MKKILIATAVTASLIATAGVALADRKHGRHGHGHGHFGWQMFSDMQALDTDGDGNVSKEEVDGHIRTSFAAMDADGNGSLNTDELAAAYVAEIEKRAGDIAARHLGKLDDDNDGAVSFEEISATSKTDKIFDRVDSNDDGVLDSGEIAKLESHMKNGKKRWWRWGRN